MILKKLYEYKIKYKMTEVTDIKIYVLLEDIKELAKKNIDKGVLGMAKYPSDFDLFKKNEKFLNLKECFSYIENIEKLKENIKQTFDLKNEFLNFISKRNGFRLERAIKISKKWYDVGLKVENKYLKLEEITKMKFSPLYLIYSVYLSEVSENFGKADKTLKKFQKIFKFNDIGKIFRFRGIDSLSIKKLLIFWVEVNDKESTQVFKYTSSNCFNLLGWKNEELLNQKIEAIIPNPLKDIHYIFFEIKEGKGN